MGLELILNDQAVGLMSAGEFLAFIRWLQSLDEVSYPELTILGEEPWSQEIPTLFRELTVALKRSSPRDRIALGPASDLLKAIAPFKRDDDAVIYYTDGVNFASDEDEAENAGSNPGKRRQKPVTAKKTVAALYLNLRREFFDAILAGKKKTEYRDNTDYWRRRLLHRRYAEVHFRNGYAAVAPTMRVECKGIRKLGRGRGSRFAIRLGGILEAKNYKSR